MQQNTPSAQLITGVSGPEAAGPADSESVEPVLEWQVHLARSRPDRAVWVVIAAFASSALCFLLFHNWLYAGFCIIAIVSATTEFLFPIRYRLDAEGAEMRNLHNWRRIAWSEVKKAYLLEDGVKVSPLGMKTRLEPFRGVFLRFGPSPGTQEEVLAAVRRFRDAVRSNAD